VRRVRKVRKVGNEGESKKAGRRGGADMKSLIIVACLAGETALAPPSMGSTFLSISCFLVVDFPGGAGCEAFFPVLIPRLW